MPYPTLILILILRGAVVVLDALNEYVGSIVSFFEIESQMLIRSKWSGLDELIV